ncbi:MAG: asparagine synthase-related protein [Kofleriaceae bacterium]|nr:asparagine synthase-related protein [Kofleriaceae bacterium]
MTAICGIVGEWARASDARTHLDQMLSSFSSTGSRNTATWTDRTGMCRLGITDRYGGLTPPRVLEEGSLAAVVDGHVFDRSAGWGADERLLRRWNATTARELGRSDAQFAFALWDAAAGRLTLARDALGVRSIFYYSGTGGIIFASTIEALLKHPAVQRKVDERAVSLFLTFLNVPAPHTLFAGVSKLPPGSFAVGTARGIERTEKFWQLVDDPIPPVDNMGHYVDRVRRLHHDAVASRLTRGPMAALLSGGNDSSANVALMAKLGVAPLHTFTVGMAEFEGQELYSDMVHARKVAKLVGSEHHERMLSLEEFIASMSECIDAQDDLVSEPSSVFLHSALKMVREAGLRTVITGEANDEISCGHGGMVNIRDGYHQRWRPLLKLPRVVRRVLAAMAPVISPAHVDVLSRAAEGGEYFWNFEIAWRDSDKDRILTPSVLDRTRTVNASALVAERAREIRKQGHSRHDYLAYMIATMMQDHYLGNLMLGKLEHLSSRLGIEARCPYTAPAYVHFVYNIPSRFKARDGEVKSFFKAAIGELLPHEIIYRPKQGFRTPLAELFRGPFGDWAKPILLDRGMTASGVLRRDTLANLFMEHRKGPRDLSTRLWTALVLNMWHERWIERGAR